MNKKYEVIGICSKGKHPIIRVNSFGGSFLKKTCRCDSYNKIHPALRTSSDFKKDKNNK